MQVVSSSTHQVRLGSRTSAQPDEPGPAEIQPVANEARDRLITGIVTALPMIAVFVAGWQVWGGALRPGDLIVFGIMYLLTGFGVTVGFHRLFTHRSFVARRPVRVALGILGSAAIEGPMISWVADHRKHHAYSDQVGDPHSPHVDHGSGWSGALRGLFHAHVGWLFIHSTFILWAILGLATPFFLGLAIGGDLRAGLTGLLWGGAVRMLVVHHVTYSINSLCHFFGQTPYSTGDQSRNLAWLAPFTFGEAWHNNHHAFPTSAQHGLNRWQLDPSSWVIWTLERLGLVRNVVRVSPERRQRKLGMADRG
jgi:stearoyl-CoA desaturase (delta-9 desaturase)